MSIAGAVQGQEHARDRQGGSQRGKGRIPSTSFLTYLRTYLLLTYTYLHLHTSYFLPSFLTYLLLFTNTYSYLLLFNTLLAGCDVQGHRAARHRCHRHGMCVFLYYIYTLTLTL
jgi:hypothetical protein